MSRVSVLVGYGKTDEIDKIAIVCPFCHSKITPNYLFLNEDNLFVSCPNSDCNKHFVLNPDHYGAFTIVQPNATPEHKTFSETINRVSSEFSVIYNQAFEAEQIHLGQISGVGYRKALEFLIKDYLLSNISQDDTNGRERIKIKLLGQCIAEDVMNERIRTVAKRAVWLGNDETHYVRKWTDKDVSHLKQLIELTVRWIESEIETQELLAEMPESK